MAVHGRGNGRPDASFGTLTRVPERVEDDGRDEEHGVLFWVNKGGFPVNNYTWERMWKHISNIIPDAAKVTASIRDAKELPHVHYPKPPLTFPANMLIEDRLELVQKYMNELQYNHTGTQFYEILKHRPITGLMDTAKEMIRESLPIKCLEAVILALYLTNGMPGVERFPISFRSVFMGSEHRHVVLGMYHGGCYGALGMSRRKDLMYKPLVFKSLASLITNYHDAYKKYWHTLRKVKVGLPVHHDAHSYEQIIWRNSSLNVSSLSYEELNRELEKVARAMRSRMQKNDKLHSVYSPRKIIKSGPVTSPMSAFQWRQPLPPTSDQNMNKKETIRPSSKVHSKAKKVSEHGRRAKGTTSSHQHMKDRSSRSRSSGSDKSKKEIASSELYPSKTNAPCVTNGSVRPTSKQEYQIRI